MTLGSTAFGRRSTSCTARDVEPKSQAFTADVIRISTPFMTISGSSSMVDTTMPGTFLRRETQPEAARRRAGSLGSSPGGSAVGVELGPQNAIWRRLSQHRPIGELLDRWDY